MPANGLEAGMTAEGTLIAPFRAPSPIHKFL